MNRVILAIGACALAAIPAAAETWYWNSTHLTGNSYYWNDNLNWTNALGATGMPVAGDKAVLGIQTSGNTPYMVCGAGGESYSIAYALDCIEWPGPNTRTCNQGNFVLKCGGQGLRYMLSKSSGYSYCGVMLVGEGEVPVHVAQGGTLVMQMRMQPKSDENGKNNPVLVKEGLGTFVCFYGLGDLKYELPLALIRQGVYNVMTRRTITGCEFRFDGDDPSQILEFSWDTSGANLVLENGAIRETNGVANTAHGIRNAYDYQVQFTGTPKAQEMVFSGTFYGGAGLKWAPASSAYTFVCSNAVSATTGRVEVANGTMKLVTGASFTALAELTVGSGAVFDVDDASGANFHAETLTLGDATAQLKLPTGCALSFTAGSLGGSPLPAGTFTGQSGTDGTKVDWIDGAGTVTMETGVAAIATWTGEGGVDTLVTTADNWGGTLPDLTSGDTFASFATGGSLATLPVETALAFSGWRLSGGFDFAAAEGATPAAIGENGIAVMDAATATAYSFGWPLQLAAGQTWQLGANTTVDVDAPITGAYGLTVTGAGTLNLKTPQTGFSAPLDISCARINLFGLNPLGVGSTAASLCVDNGAPTFENITNDRPINIYLDAQASGSLTLKGTNVFNATLKMAPKNMTLTITADKDSVSVFKGTSINTDGQASVYLRGTGHIITSNTLFGINTSLYMNSSNKDYVTVDTWASMGVGGVFWGDLRYGRINTHVPNVLYGNGTYHRLSIASPGVLDLCGNDQALGAMASSGGTVTSETPALLHLNASTKYDDYGGLGRTNQVVFAGAAGFSHDGYLTNRLSAASTTVGTLKVTTGMLRLVGNASWANSTNVVVTGGTLAFENAAAITKAATVRVDGTGKIELDFDGTMTCDRLFVNGVSAGGGMFGAVGSGAQVESEIFSGAGRLLVIGRGTILSFR